MALNHHFDCRAHLGLLCPLARDVFGELGFIVDFVHALKSVRQAMENWLLLCDDNIVSSDMFRALYHAVLPPGDALRRQAVALKAQVEAAVSKHSVMNQDRMSGIAVADLTNPKMRDVRAWAFFPLAWPLVDQGSS